MSGFVSPLTHVLVEDSTETDALETNNLLV